MVKIFTFSPSFTERVNYVTQHPSIMKPEDIARSGKEKHSIPWLKLIPKSQLFTFSTVGVVSLRVCTAEAALAWNSHFLRNCCWQLGGLSVCPSVPLGLGSVCCPEDRAVSIRTVVKAAGPMAHDGQSASCVQWQLRPVRSLTLLMFIRFVGHTVTLASAFMRLMDFCRILTVYSKWRLGVLK